jgi:hypothetical protein
MQRQNQTLSRSEWAAPTALTIEEQSFAASINVVRGAQVIPVDAIRCFAYQKWETAGKPDGDGIPFWLEAENELATGKQDTSGRGNSQDADRHSRIRHPRSLKM